MYYQMKINIFAECDECKHEIQAKMVPKKDRGFINNHLVVTPCGTCIRKKFKEMIEKMMGEAGLEGAGLEIEGEVE